MSQPTAIVLGCGIIGLTTALTLQANNYNVTILTKHTPDSDTVEYTSAHAGAHWCSFASATDTIQQQYDKFTFFTLMGAAFNKSSKITGVSIVTGYGYSNTDNVETEWWSTFVPKYRTLTKTELQQLNSTLGNTSEHQIKYATQYQTLMIHSTVYTQYLYDLFESRGGTVVQQHIDSIQQITEQYKTSALIVNCTGYGAVKLNDSTNRAKHHIHTMRGQTIHIKCPAIKNVKRSVAVLREGDEPTYILPRYDGSVVLGGTYDKHNKQNQPDMQIAKRILERCAAIEPILRDNNNYTVIKHDVGFRPYSDIGTMIYTEYINNKLIIHNVGHGGFGFQSSWGCANRVLQLLNEYTNATNMAKL